MTQPDKQPKTFKDHLNAFGGALLIVGFCLLLLEGLVRFTDPWGLTFFNDLLRMGNDYFDIDPVRGYSVPDGTYKFSYWEMTIENGARVTPATNADADCTFVMLGDSVTLAHGVDDDETWINHLAQMYPDIHFVNTGMTTYNSVAVRGTKAAFPDGDAYVYLIIDNDVEPTLNPDPEAFPGQNPTNMPFLVRYVSFILFNNRAESNAPSTLPLDDARMVRFLEDVDAIIADGDTWLISLDGFPLAYQMQDLGYDVMLYTYPPYSISYVDLHLNPEGNRLFAEAVAPLIAEIRDERCNP